MVDFFLKVIIVIWCKSNFFSKKTYNTVVCRLSYFGKSIRSINELVLHFLEEVEQKFCIQKYTLWFWNNFLGWKLLYILESTTPSHHYTYFQTLIFGIPVFGRVIQPYTNLLSMSILIKKFRLFHNKVNHRYPKSKLEALKHVKVTGKGAI